MDTVSIDQRRAINIACGHYVQTIAQLERGEIDVSMGELARQEWHEQLLELTGLSMFEFGGIPAWISTNDTAAITKRLFNALIQAMQEKDGHGHS